jgi:D-alanyl-D-alanine carboxypeptidase
MATSYNGWEASPDPSAIDVDPGFRAAGCAFPGGARAGDVATVQGYVIDQLAARVEAPLLDPDSGAPGYGCWGYNYRANVNNPSTLSCHSSATALDWNAPTHPNGAVGTFSDAQRATIYDILAEVGGAVQWGGDYTGTVDEMHFEIIVDAGTLAGIAAGLPAGGGPPPTPDTLPPLDGVTMPLIVKRADGVDYAWADNLSLLVRIPTESYYVNLQAAGVISVDHGAAEAVGADLVDWLKGQVAGAGGIVFEPPQ